VDTSAEQGTGTGESITGVRTRKRRSIQQKLQIVRETLQSVDSVAVIARRHGINANQVFAWRRAYQRGQLKARPARQPKSAIVLPVEVRAVSRAPDVDSRAAQPLSSSERIEIEFPNGPRLKISGGSAETVRAMIRELLQSC
jgi:transposase-like protein